jgi:hypothetical protein
MIKRFLLVLTLMLALTLIFSTVALADSGYTPSAPSNLAGTATDGGIVLTWTDNSSVEEGFLVFRKLSTDSAWSTDHYASTVANITTYTDTNVVKGKTYNYKIIAVGIQPGSGWIPIPQPTYSAESNIISVFVPFNWVIITPPVLIVTAPAAPTNLSLPAGYQAQPDSVSLKWTDNATDEAGFIIERRRAAGSLMIYYMWAEVDRVAADVKTYLDEDVEADTSYEYRVCAYKENLVLDSDVLSDYSNILTATTAAATVTPPVTPPGTYPGASSWAVAEIDLAVKAGLTTADILSNFQNSITREEFCEIAVKLYEALSGETAQPINPNPFTDTSNSEILKAYNLGIVKGVAADKFAPNKNITRQEICVMLLRAIKAVQPGADYSAVGVGAFADESSIADWAIDAVRYMSKEGIMKGVGAGKIDPLGNTTREQAILLIYRTYGANL